MIKRKTIWRVYILFKILGDLFLSIVAFFISYYFRFYDKFFISFFPPVKGIPELKFYYDIIPFYIIVVFFSMVYCRFYKKELLDPLDEFLKVLKSSIICGLLLFTVSFFYRSYEYSRLFMVIIIIYFFVFVFSWHQILKYFYRKYLKFIFGKPRIGVIAEKHKIIDIKKKILKDKTVKIFFLENVDTEENLLSFINKKNINELIIEYVKFDTEIFQKLLADLDKMNIDIKVLINIPVRLSDTNIDATLGFPVIAIRPGSLSGINYIIKRSIDILVSIFALSVSIIPMSFIALAIKLESKGPVFYKHKRMGLRGRIFDCIKFRTMVNDAHKYWNELLKFSERGQKVFKLKKDPRVTKIGSLLRRWSIDEIPQFFNILRGDMSVVGPRPQILEEANFYDHYDKRRLMVPPGLTGLWQISGRADIGYEEMIRLDIFYLENWSLGLDLRIIFNTILAVFSKKGAY